MTPHRLVVWPWLRRIGGRLLPQWLAITLGGTIFAWRPLSDTELEHELAHVRQWRSAGLRFPLAYLAESVRAVRAGKRWYRDNRFEADARAAAARVRPR